MPTQRPTIPSLSIAVQPPLLFAAGFVVLLVVIGGSGFVLMRAFGLLTEQIKQNSSDPPSIGAVAFVVTLITAALLIGIITRSLVHAIVAVFVAPQPSSDLSSIKGNFDGIHQHITTLGQDLANTHNEINRISDKINHIRSEIDVLQRLVTIEKQQDEQSAPVIQP